MAELRRRPRTGDGCSHRRRNRDRRKEGAGRSSRHAAPGQRQRRAGRRLAQLRPPAADAIKEHTMAKVTIGGRSYEVEIRGDSVVVDGHEFPVKVREEGAYATVTAGSVPYRIQLPPIGARESGMSVQVDYRPFIFEFEGRL